MLYAEKDIESSMNKIETVNFHQVSIMSDAVSGLMFALYDENFNESLSLRWR